MRTRRDGLAEFGKEQVHCGGIEPGHHQSDTGVAGRADGADDPGGLVADIAQPARGMAALPPDIAGPPLLPTRASSWLQISNRSASGCACAISVKRAASPLF